MSSAPLSRMSSMQSGLGAALGDPAPEDDLSQNMRISLQLEASSLPNMDKKGKSDPFTILYKRVDRPASASTSAASAREEWAKIGQTETVYNNLNPKWSTTFSLEYRFGSNSVLKFSIYDRDSKKDDLTKQDYIGEVRCTVAQIVLADSKCLVLQVNNPNARPGAKTGTLTIRGEEEKGDLGDSVTFQFAVTALRRGKKPFYVLSRRNADASYGPVTYSEVHQGYGGATNVTTFKPITKSLAKLVNGDMDRELKIEFRDYDRRGNHYTGGSATFTLRSAKAAMAASGSAGARYKLKKTKSNGQVVDAGTLIMRRCEISIPFSFLDYIQAGVVMNVVVAVDMSATNGNPLDPSSLQYNNRQAPNEYVIALREVGNVLAAYDTSKTFPAFGFGAALPPRYTDTAHCFALTGNIQQPVCDGVEGVIDMYYNALCNVAPYQPCHYGPVLEHVTKMTKEEDARDGRTVYTVLLLVTDGDFEDFSTVANLICAAAELPLSIVIVGVGNSTFVMLDKLDGDKVPLCSTDGTPCARDIVQFVEFHKHRYNPAQLAKEVLDEIPEQMVSYMRSRNIKPSDVVPSNRLARPDSRRPGPYIPEGRSASNAGPMIPPHSGPMIPPSSPMRMQPTPSYGYQAHQAHQPPPMHQATYPSQYSMYTVGMGTVPPHNPAQPYAQPSLQDQGSQYSHPGIHHHMSQPLPHQPSYPQQSYPPEPQ